MKHILDRKMNRRDFTKLSLLAAGSAAIPFTGGCSTLAVKKNAPVLTRDLPVRLINCNIVDVENSSIKKNGSIIINNGKIHAITEQKGLQDNRYETFDLKGQYVIPGLIEAHCHTTSPGTMAFNIFETPADMRQNKNSLPQYIESGITTIRDTGAMVNELNKRLEDIKNGVLIGPRIIYCNSILNIDGGHPDIKPSDLSIFGGIASAFLGSLTTDFRSTQELKEKMVENAGNGAKFIKLTVDDTSCMLGRKKIKIYSDEHLKIIFDFAEKMELPVVCHNHFKYGFDRLSKYPVHSFEHLICDSLKSDSEIETMVKKNIAIVPTAVVAQYLAPYELFDKMPKIFQTDFIENELKIKEDYFNTLASNYCDPVIHANNMRNKAGYKNIDNKKWVESMKVITKPEIYYNILTDGITNLKRMREAGVLIGCGTDAGTPFNYHGALWREMELYHRIGFTNHEVLKCATLNNAKILGISDETGSIKEGKLADLVVLNKNPYEDITAFRKPEMVFREGELMFSSRQLRNDSGSWILDS